MNINEKAAYLKGLLDGFQIDESKPENKLIKEIISAISDLADEVTALTEETEVINDFLDELDYDLGAIEEDFYCDDDDYDCDCGCDCDCDCDDFEDDYFEDAEEESDK